MNGMAAFRHDFLIGADHPCLAGHFPDAPLVPGVMLLEQVALALRACRGQRLARVVDAKFMAPLLPGQAAQVWLTDAASRVRFEVRREGELIARGTVEGAA